MFKECFSKTVYLSVGIMPNKTKSYRSEMGSAHFASKMQKAENV